jgi:hypothetical protein
MGLDFNGARFLLNERQSGVQFTTFATIGRQSLLLRPWMLSELAKRNGLDWAGKSEELFATGYAEPILKMLGAQTIDSFDYSSYEQATVVHDFNRVIPTEFHDRYDVVLDGGSLEHVFNMPQAIANCMSMVKVGGRYLGITPANNLFGHGFYQFSAEFYFRVLSEENGFSDTRIYIAEVKLDAPFYQVIDPNVVRERVTLTNSNPVVMYVSAHKDSSEDILVTSPQQSDYASIWSDHKRQCSENDAADVPIGSNTRPTHQRWPFWLLKLCKASKCFLGSKKSHPFPKKFFSKCDF